MSRAWWVVIGIAAVAGLAMLLLPRFTDSPRESLEPESPGVVAGGVDEMLVDPADLPTWESEGASPEATGTELAFTRSTDLPSSSTLAHRTEVGGVLVEWSNDDEILTLRLSSPGAGHVAIGISSDRPSEDANILLGAVRGSAVLYRDDVGTGPTGHVADRLVGGTNDILSAAGWEIDGATVFEFSIPLDSGDPADTPLAPGGVCEIRVAYHDTDDGFSVDLIERGRGTIELDDAP